MVKDRKVITKARVGDTLSAPVCNCGKHFAFRNIDAASKEETSKITLKASSEPFEYGSNAGGYMAVEIPVTLHDIKEVAK